MGLSVEMRLDLRALEVVYPLTICVKGRSYGTCGFDASRLIGRFSLSAICCGILFLRQKQLCSQMYIERSPIPWHHHLGLSVNLRKQILILCVGPAPLTAKPV